MGISERVNALCVSQRGTMFLWSPVALTVGIWFYFSRLQEPPASLFAAFAVLAIGLILVSRCRGGAILMALVLLGCVLAKVRTELVATPLLKSPTGEVAVVGIVTDIQGASAKRATLVLQPTEIEGMPRERMPVHLRLTHFTRNGNPSIGDRIAFKARLSPIPSPVMPGGFDYGRQLFFESVGGVGRITTPLTTLDETPPGDLVFARHLATLRKSMGDRIRSHLSGTMAALAEAMITGERAAIPKDINRTLQVSGLAHILSISGLHMSLAAGGIYWLVRAALAMITSLALNYPIKKWAAAAALVFGFVYMLLAGCQAATQRSYIMLAVMLLAIMVDRPAVSMRNLAIAALLILISQPECAVQASFQMSFMAVLGLAAFFEYWNATHHEREFKIETTASWIMRKLWRGLVAAILTSVVAGAFSSIPAVYHFGRIAPYGVLANVLAVPVMSCVVMPAALLSVALMPFGLDGLPLDALGQGLSLIIKISDFVAGLPGAQRVLPQITAAGAICMALGATELCLLRGRAKMLAVPLIFGGVLINQTASQPDVLVERTVANVAARNSQGELIFARRKGKFAAEKWLQANGEVASLKEAYARSGWLCDDSLCRTTIHNKTIGVLAEENGATPACEGLDVVIADYPLRRKCRNVALRIDRIDVWKHGAHAVRIDDGMMTVTTARGSAGIRPWTMVPEPRRQMQPYNWRGASTHSPLPRAGSLRGNAPRESEYNRPAQ